SVVYPAAEKFVVPQVSEENVNGGSAAVGRDQVLQIDRLLGQFTPEFLQSGVRRIDVRDEQRVLLGHAGNDVLHVGEANDILHLGDLFDLVGQALDLLQHLGRVDIVGNHTDHADFVAAKQATDFVVVFPFRIVRREQAVYRTV